MTTFLVVQDWGWGEKSLHVIDCSREGLEVAITEMYENDDRYNGKPSLDPRQPVIFAREVGENVIGLVREIGKAFDEDDDDGED